MVFTKITRWLSCVRCEPVWEFICVRQETITFVVICKLLTALSEREDLMQKSETEEESLLVVLVARLLLICTDNIRVAEINIRKETKNKSHSLYPLFLIFFCTFFLHVHPPHSDCAQICNHPKSLFLLLVLLHMPTDCLCRA